MSRATTVLVVFLLLLGACAEPRSVEATAEQIEAWRLETSGERPAPTPFPTPLADSSSEPADGIPLELSMTDLLGQTCNEPAPVADAAPYELKPGIHPIWVVDVFSNGGGTAPAWLQPEWSASDASTVELIACMSVVPVGDPFICDTTGVVGSFVAIEVYIASSGVLLGRFSNATEATCADFDSTAYLAENAAGDQVVADIAVINAWLEPIVAR